MNLNTLINVHDKISSTKKMHDDINKFANDNNTSNPQRICVFGMVFLWQKLLCLNIILKHGA
jgi:hypothetical protein